MSSPGFACFDVEKYETDAMCPVDEDIVPQSRVLLYFDTLIREFLYARPVHEIYAEYPPAHLVVQTYAVDGYAH